MHKYSTCTHAAIYSKKQDLKYSCLEDHILFYSYSHTAVLHNYFFQFCYANMQINELNHS